MVRRDKTTIFLDCKEATTVYELKKMVEGIMKKAPDDQRLYKDDQILDDAKTLEDCGFTTQTAKAQSPALIKLSFRGEGEFFLSRLNMCSNLNYLNIHGRFESFIRNYCDLL